MKLSDFLKMFDTSGDSAPETSEGSQEGQQSPGADAQTDPAGKQSSAPEGTTTSTATATTDTATDDLNLTDEQMRQIASVVNRRAVSPHVPATSPVQTRTQVDPYDFDRELTDEDVDRFIGLPLDLQDQYRDAFRRGMEKTPMKEGTFQEYTPWIDTPPVRFGSYREGKSGFRVVRET